MLRASDVLVAVRTELINTTRGLAKSMGQRLPRCSSQSFAAKAEEGLPVEIREALLPLVQFAAALSDCIQEYDRKVEEMASQKYGHTKARKNNCRSRPDCYTGKAVDDGDRRANQLHWTSGVMAMACTQ